MVMVPNAILSAVLKMFWWSFFEDILKLVYVSMSWTYYNYEVHTQCCVNKFLYCVLSGTHNTHKSTTTVEVTNRHVCARLCVWVCVCMCVCVCVCVCVCQCVLVCHFENVYFKLLKRNRNKLTVNHIWLNTHLYVRLVFLNKHNSELRRKHLLSDVLVWKSAI